MSTAPVQAPASRFRALPARFLKRTLGAAVLTLLTGSVLAEDLVQVFDLAVHHPLFPLLDKESRTRAAFLARNLATLEKAREEEAKKRRAGLVADEDWQARWYLDRLPPEINSIAGARHGLHTKIPGV